MYRILSLALLMITALSVAACGGSPSGEVAEPSASGPTISANQYLSSVADTDHILLDVRTAGEVAGGVIPGATHIALDELPARVSELPEDATIVVYCRSGNRSRSATRILANAGRTNLLDLGGVLQWQASGNSLVPLGS